MGENSGIGWTNHTFNPWWGCTEVSDACDHCYARTLAQRFGHAVWGKDAPRRTLSDANWRLPLRWDRDAELAGRPALVFCASMADVFEARDDLDPLRSRLWELVEQTPHLIWQLLTKRPEQVARRVPPPWLASWPRNAWLGTTVEDERAARIRVPRLLAIPAPVRFLSCEPLLGDVDLWPYLEHVSWVIAGGESGPHARPMSLDAVRRIRDDCVLAGVPFFFKQWGGLRPDSGGCELDGELWRLFPAGVRA